MNHLIVNSNMLSGVIPNVSSPYLLNLVASDNSIVGEVPDLAESSMLERLILSSNSISGSLAKSLSMLTNLRALILHNNRFDTAPVDGCD